METQTRTFASSREHVLAELTLLDLRLGLEVRNGRKDQTGSPADEFRGLMIDEERVDSLLYGQPTLGRGRKTQSEIKLTRRRRRPVGSMVRRRRPFDLAPCQ